jgi:hypothetical protein
MYTDSHIDLLTAIDVELSNCVNHRETHLDAAFGMIGSRFRTAGNTIVAIA